jgi:hypothetical protein
MKTSTFEEILKVVRQAEHLGSRKLTTGVELIGHVPCMAPQAYLHVLFPPLNDEKIEEIETNIGHILPSDLKDFYGYSNGIMLFASGLYVDGLRRNFARRGDESRQPFSIITPNTHERPVDSPDSLVFFGGHECDGSLLGMFPDSPEVFRFAPCSVKVLNEWPSFDAMLLSEIRRLSLLFDAQGRKINEHAPTKPTEAGHDNCWPTRSLAILWDCGC